MFARDPQRDLMVIDLREFPVFAGCSPDEMRIVIDLGRLVSIEAGEALMVEGKGARGCCLLLEGDAEVRAGGEAVAVLRPGSLVGELSLLTNKPRSSTVVARSSVRALMFDGATFTTLLSEMPGLRARVLAQEEPTSVDNGPAAQGTSV